MEVIALIALLVTAIGASVAISTPLNRTGRVEELERQGAMLAGTGLAVFLILLFLGPK